MIGIKALAATLSVPAPCTLSGTLTKTAAPSGGIVTSDSVTVSVPPGNSGDISIFNFSFTGTVGPEYNLNGAGWVTPTDGSSFTASNGQTLQVRMTGATAGESWTFTLRDNTRQVNIGTYTLTAS